MEKSTRWYECHSCLMGSTDPVVCTNCGVLIRELDLSGAMVIPPIWGVVVIDQVNQEDLDVVMHVIDGVANSFYQNFSAFEIEGKLVIECNEIAAAKLIPRLEIELRGRRPDLVICFEGKPEQTISE